MKKLGFLFAALALFSVVFTSCKKNDEPAAGKLYDGFYLVGEATAVADFNSSDIALAYMGAGFNENGKEKRSGMYEKYVALEGNKPFKFILHEAGKNDVSYGGNLELKEADTDSKAIEVYWAQLAENVEMVVPVSGLYHVVLDLNLDGKLTATGGKQIMLVPVAWGIRGSFTSSDWGTTWPANEASAFDKKHMEFKFKNDTVKVSGGFKFVQADCWKINLDMMGEVRCETSLGVENGEMTIYGESIDIPIERGIYNMTLTWDLKGGAIGKSFTYKTEKIGEPEIEEFVPADHIYGLVGSFNDWGNSSVSDIKFVYGEKDGDFYVAETPAFDFTADTEFKIRENEDWGVNYGWGQIELLGDADNFENANGNIKVKANASYAKAVLRFKWNGAEMTDKSVEFVK